MGEGASIDAGRVSSDSIISARGIVRPHQSDSAASVSIGANIAEGAGKNSRPEFARFLQIALGSASELEYHLLLSRDLGYLAGEIHQPLCAQVVETKKMLTGFIQHLCGAKTGTDG